jgi:hypothetical protein
MGNTYRSGSIQRDGNKMKRNIQKNPMESLRSFTRQQIEDLLTLLPISIPAKVVSNEGATVTVTPMITFYDLSAVKMPNVPIIKSKFLNLPLQEGDFGMIVSASYYFQNIVTDDATEIDDVIQSTVMNNMFFLPLVQKGSEPTDGKETTLLSKSLEKKITVKDDGIELNGNTGFVAEWTNLNSKLQDFFTKYNSDMTTIKAGATAAIAASGFWLTPLTSIGSASVDLASAKTSDVKVAKN